MLRGYAGAILRTVRAIVYKISCSLHRTGEAGNSVSRDLNA